MISVTNIIAIFSDFYWKYDLNHYFNIKVNIKDRIDWKYVEKYIYLC